MFLSVQWFSGAYPDRLKIAIAHSDAVFSVWDGDRLVGLANAMSDSIMNVHIQYLLVHPEYQCLGIGKWLIQRMREKYVSCLRLTLIAYDSAMDFYQMCGFSLGTGVIPMSISNLNSLQENE